MSVTRGKKLASTEAFAFICDVAIRLCGIRRKVAAAESSIDRLIDRLIRFADESCLYEMHVPKENRSISPDISNHNQSFQHSSKQAAHSPQDSTSNRRVMASRGAEQPAERSGQMRGGTDVKTVSPEHHTVAVTPKGSAVLQAMEAREVSGGQGGGSEVLASKAAPLPASLAARVHHAANTTGVFVTDSPEEVVGFV